ncbi:LCP family protein [Abyssicoccus albus]|uniref:Regulatory protein MsrR n=1 Tax=Abyssicoccus albus TaxID=1817405 RepID=A0A3N5BN11_9BACL|nr:LCP family protein [Abyssicoccus albus]RPF57949.1 LytR family transcriptional attenuator [Abyssicoccus albus]
MTEYRRSNKQYKTKTIKKTRVKKTPFIIIGLLFLLIAFIIYNVSSYRAGLDETDDKQSAVKHNIQMDQNSDGKMTVLLIGHDRVVDNVARADTIMIGQYDFINKKAKIMPIMRDSVFDIPGYRDYKINSAYSLGGPELLSETIEHNLNIHIDHYAIVNYNAFEHVVDTVAPNGVHINVEKTMSKGIDMTLEQGDQRLNGTELLRYARFRQDSEGDFGRVRRQQQVLSALKDEALSFNTIFKLPKTLGIARGYIDTDMSNYEMSKALLSFIVRSDKDIDTMQIPVENSYQMIDHPELGAVLDIDVEMNKRAVDEFLNREDNGEITRNNKKR